ncbi:hypothetical protein F5Y16DRAFT_408706 [Xylariaceae sp. FL0255]|nr:hypothetical protein F5Y16DRAFT_408706 [Xylariaceae sp. FL0255]
MDLSSSEPSSDKLDGVDIFRDVCDQFQSSLSDSQRQLFQSFPDAKSMLASVQQQFKTHPVHATVLTKCCGKISKLSDTLSVYFSVIDIFISSHPDFAAIAWGTIRLIFTLGHNHVVFLERVCDMFESMGTKLQIYHDLMDAVRARKHPCSSSHAKRLLKTMSFIYSDLIQFCFDMCQAFSLTKPRYQGRVLLKCSFFSSLPSLKNKFFATPFNVRYDTLLKRWDHHQKIMELEISALSNIEQLKTADMVESMLDKFNNPDDFFDTNTRAHLGRDTIECNVQRWINSPSWLEPFEMASARRCDRTSSWFIQLDETQEWMFSLDPRHNTTPPLSMLSVQGKPGFGKTVLCTNLIEYLQRHHEIFGVDEPNTTAVAFYYFDGQKKDITTSSAAFRAIAMQLLYRLSQDDPDALDIFLILREKRTGQPTASDTEILSALSLLLQRFDHLYLIFDGIDECLDYEILMSGLSTICQIPGLVSVAFFSRPTIQLTSSIAKNAVHITLGSDFNLEDIKTFLRFRLSSLNQYGLLQDSLELENTIESVAGRANGMFLWATLLTKYLESPYLSTRQRKDALENLNRLEGIDNLYTTINIVVRIFSIALYSSPTPLNRARLGTISGALMELDKHEHVRFVHLSVGEFLADPCTGDNLPSLAQSWTMGQESGQRRLACICLSYLFYTIASEPLAGNASIVPKLDEQRDKYPLLDYATQFWSAHVLDCLESIENSHMVTEDMILVDLASRFLSNKAAVSVWIEACWMFQRRPRIRNGSSDEFFQVMPHQSAHLTAEEQRLFNRASLTLIQLSQDLDNLHQSWSYLLSDRPNEIWEPSISGFNYSSFWQRIEGSDISRRFPPDEHHGAYSTCLRSQLTTDGSCLGILRAYIALEPLKATLFFELWSTSRNHKLKDVYLYIPESCLNPFNEKPPNNCFHQIHIPVAMSDSFKRIAAPGCIFNLRCSGDLSSQMTSKPPWQQQLVDFTGNCSRYGSFKFSIEDCSLKYDLQMSASGEYLMTIHKSKKRVDISRGWSCVMRFLTIYQDMSAQTSESPDYKYISSLAFKPRFERDGDKDGEFCAVLNPILPVVAISYDNVIITCATTKGFEVIKNQSLITSSAVNRKEEFKFFSKTPGSLKFDQGGELFCGTPVRQWVSGTGWSFLHQGQESDSARSPTTLSRSRDQLSLVLPYATQPHFQNQGEIINYKGDNTSIITSQLHHSDNGELVLATMEDDGAMTAELLTRLPQQILSNSQASLIKPRDVEMSDEREILLGPATRPFARHQIQSTRDKEHGGPHLPMILRRERGTIPTINGNIVGHITSPMAQFRKRLGDRTDGFQIVKRHRPYDDGI